MKFYKMILFMLIVACLIGCNEENEIALFDENDNYIGFDSSEYEIGDEEAISKKYVIVENTKIIENYDEIKLFMKKANNGEKAHIRFRHYLSDRIIMYHMDLFYDDDGYHYYLQNQPDAKKVSYQYLVDVTGFWGPYDFRRILVVTDDPDITMEEIHDARISASFDMETDIAKHVVVLIDYHINE